jgi:hypothetical protein
MALPNRMSLLPGLLWLALNLTLIIQCLSRNNFFFVLRTPKDVFAYPRGYAYPRLKATALN